MRYPPKMYGVRGCFVICRSQVIFLQMTTCLMSDYASSNERTVPQVFLNSPKSHRGGRRVGWDGAGGDKNLACLLPPAPLPSAPISPSSPNLEQLGCANIPNWWRGQGVPRPPVPAFQVTKMYFFLIVEEKGKSFVTAFSCIQSISRWNFDTHLITESLMNWKQSKIRV